MTAIRARIEKIEFQIICRRNGLRVALCYAVAWRGVAGFWARSALATALR